jgi:hypothetical protein
MTMVERAQALMTLASQARERVCAILRLSYRGRGWRREGYPIARLPRGECLARVSDVHRYQKMAFQRPTSKRLTRKSILCVELTAESALPWKEH